MDLADIFGPTGPLTQIEGYEHRPGQVDLALAVQAVLNTRHPGIFKAGTGIGKSLAYAVPPIWATYAPRDEDDISVPSQVLPLVIATSTKNLQDQLFEKDLPFIVKVLNLPFLKFARLKGISNYFCHRNAQEVKLENTWLIDQLEGKIAEGWGGDWEALDVEVESRERARLSTDVDNCDGKRCPFALQCCYRQNRENAKDAKVLIINHHVLAMDMKMGGEILLPAYRSLVIDEAHAFDEAITGVFGSTWHFWKFMGYVKRTRRALKQCSVPDPDGELQAELDAVNKNLAEECRTFFADIDAKNLPIRLTPALKRTRSPGPVLAWAEKLVEVLKKATKHIPAGTPNEKILERIVRQIRADVTVGSDNWSNDDPNMVGVVDRNTHGARQGAPLEFTFAPIDVRPILKDHLWNKGKRIVMTSATLGYGNRVGDFARKVAAPDAISTVFSSPFDYKRQALIFTSGDGPPPDYQNEAAFQAYAAKRIVELVDASRGRAFVLCSSRRAMEYYANLLGARFAKEYQVLLQGTLTKTQIIERFKERPSVLFGTKSFREGVDIAGEALSLVIFDKIPFPSPSDVISAARSEQYGDRWFYEYALPEAAEALEQAFGRLIRRMTDRGCFAILDTRMEQKYKAYGKAIMEALPPASWTDRIEDVRAFFEAEEAAA